MISFICAYNNNEILDKFLISSLNNQKCKDYELITINAKEKGFKSASETLNYGASVSNGDILVFVHQDVKFEENNIIEKINLFCNENSFGIAGVAGVEYGNKQVYSSISQGDNHIQVGQPILEVKEVASLDECLLIVKKNSFKKFDEYKSWHFYGVEYSLRCYIKGEKVLLFPLKLYHLSPGKSLNDNYWITLKKVAKKFKNLNLIPTTITQFKNNCFLYFQIFKLKRKLSRRIK